jgi:glycosyltransferase involved in cell wall biosynthesis
MSASPTPEKGISVIIPTRNRPASLRRLLRSLDSQTLRVLETLIVDASDGNSGENLPAEFPALRIRLFRSPPSVCRQRNIGVAAARGTFLQFADDDVEFPPGYLAALAAYAAGHPDAGAISGLQLDVRGTGSTYPDRRPIGALTLVWSFIFQTSAWGSLEEINAGRIRALIFGPILAHYRRRGNTFSLGGWPLLTRVEEPVSRSAVYGLGAAMIRRDLLPDAPFDESLGPHGIGENYGVAIGLRAPISLLTDMPFRHHREGENRLPPPKAYVRRILALDYFMKRSGRFHGGHRMMLRWSVIGHCLGYLIRGNGRMCLGSAEALVRLLVARG